MKILALVSIQCALCLNAKSQVNLIRNGGFEDIFELPPNNSRMHLNKFSLYMMNWLTYYYSSPDLYSSLQPDSTFLSIPSSKSEAFDIVPDSLRYNFTPSIHRNNYNFIGLANMDSTAPFVKGFIWNKESIFQNSISLKKNHKYKIGFHFLHQKRKSYLSKIDWSFSQYPIQKKDKQYNIENFRNAQAISINLNYTNKWDSISTYFVANNNHTSVFIGSIGENNRYLNMPEAYIAYYGYYSYTYLDNLFLQEVPCIIGRDSICLGQIDTLTTTITAPRKWCTDPNGLNVFSSDSFVYINVNSKQQTIYCFGQNGMDSISIHGIDIEDPNWADTLQLCDQQLVTISAGTNEYKYVWNDGFNLNKRIIGDQGLYQVMVSNHLGCRDSFSTFVNYNFIPHIHLKDTFIHCFVDHPLFELKVVSDSFNCLWEDMIPNSCELKTHLPGHYKLMAKSNFSDCKSEKSVLILDQCEPLVFVPTAFYPNSSHESNKVFKPLIKYTSSTSITIYNSWGELIWKSNDPNDAWDGTSSGKACPQGLYLCCVQIIGELSDNNQSFKQIIQLLR